MSRLTMEDRTAAGIAVEEEITGHKARTPATPVELAWRDFIYAEVWSRSGLSRKARYIIAICSAITSGLEESRIDAFIHGAIKGGHFNLTELREAALHLAVYKGWGAGGKFDAAITRVADALGLPPVEAAPLRSGPWEPQERQDIGSANFAYTMTFPTGPLTTPYVHAIKNFVFGEMWQREGLDEITRRWITLVGVCESGAEIPIRSHFYAALKSGNCTPEELSEFVLQYATHAGWPNASRMEGVILDIVGRVERGESFM